MDLLDLPSLSDEDELDYEVGETTEIVPSGSEAVSKNPSNLDKVGNEKGMDEQQEGDEIDGNASTGTKGGNMASSSSLPHQQLISRKRKLRNSDTVWSDDDDDDLAEYESCESGEDDDIREVTINMPGRLAGRVKRMVNNNKDKKADANSDDNGDDDVEDGPEENVAAELFAQILDGKSENRRNLNDEELEELYASLEADPDDAHLRFNTIFVTGAVDNMTIFDISRIFAQFNPENVRPLDHSAAFLVTFANPLVAAEMLLEMSKPLRRIRKAKKPEEGELMESSEEDEEGQVKEEDGEDVAIVRDESPRKRKGSLLRSNSNAVEVDVQTVKIPNGKWRVITQHIPDNKLIFVRFASGFELRRSVYIGREQNREENFTYKNTKIRPGLNVFDEKGNELDWDYEHDTRFFEDVGGENEQQGDAETAAGGSNANAAGGIDEAIKESTMLGGIKIRSRGRGAKKFLQALKGSDDEQ